MQILYNRFSAKPHDDFKIRATEKPFLVEEVEDDDYRDSTNIIKMPSHGFFNDWDSRDLSNKNSIDVPNLKWKKTPQLNFKLQENINSSLITNNRDSDENIELKNKKEQFKEYFLFYISFFNNYI